MKINLLREDQMTKVPHQDKEKEVLRFDDTFSGGNDDFYFQQPTPPAEEYKKPKKFKFWLFLLVFIVVGFGVVFVLKPDKTIDFFVGFGNGVSRVWHRTTDKIQTSWLHRKDRNVTEFVPPVQVKEEVKEDAKQPARQNAEQQVIKVTKPIEKEVVKESTEEKVLESPMIFDKIKDEIALSRRNMIAAEFVWSKVPGGMIMDRLTISEDKMSVSVRSRYPMLIHSYAKVIEQHDIFKSVLTGNEEKVGELTRIQLTSDLPPLRKEDRPERIWDLDVEWFDDYLVIAANASDVTVSQNIVNSKDLEDGILVHDIKVITNGTRTAILRFLQELQAIPAAFVVRDISSNYDEMDQSNMMEMTLIYYERE